MCEVLRAVRYRSLDEARRHLRELRLLQESQDPFDDGGEEPQGLFSVVTEDLLGEEIFYRLFSVEKEKRKGVLVEVERIPYSGYGPPAEEEDYMGFTSRGVAYVLKGCRLPVEIRSCPDGARDIHHLEALILDGKHPFDPEPLRRHLGLPEEWDFEDLFRLICEGGITAEKIDRLLHQAVSRPESSPAGARFPPE